MKSSTRRTGKSPEQRKAEAQSLHDSLTAQVEALSTSEAWKKFLTFSTGFHNYSFGNLMLILSQNPDATRVAGFKAWQSKGRQVRKGETSLKIFGFSRKTTEDAVTGEETSRVFYPVVSVFDVSQTDPIDGVEQPQDFTTRLEGEDTAGAVSLVTTYLTGLGWTVSREPISGEVNGFATADGSQRVVIDSRLSDAHAAKTALHEAAHVVLGHCAEGGEDYVAHRGLKECEAESVAFVLAGILGLDTASYSVGYVTGWTKGDVSLLKDTATKVLKAVHVLADALVGTDVEEEVAA